MEEKGIFKKLGLKGIFKKLGLNGSVLKLIAIFTMAIDHTAAVLLINSYSYRQLYDIMRNVGRIAFPIFCFLLVEGFVHTHDVKKYAIRLGAFAVISEIPYNLAFSGRFFGYPIQNVFFTLLIGLLVLICIKYLNNNPVFIVIPIVTGCLLAELLHSDYDFYGVLLIVSLYLFRNFRYARNVSVIIFNISLFQVYGIFSIFFMELYNGKKGMKLKYVFYAFYPVHLLILFMIAKIICYFIL